MSVSRSHTSKDSSTDRRAPQAPAAPDSGNRLLESNSAPIEHRAILLAPTGRDSDLIAALLNRNNHACQVVSSAARLVEEVGRGAGAAIVSEEALTGDAIPRILAMLEAQPAWSDFPLILLTVGGRVATELAHLREFCRPLGNAFVLERPLRQETLISTLEVALRGRERQYQIRDQIAQYERAQEALRRSEKLAVTGRLAASIAHEINNPLEAVTNLIYLARKEPSAKKRHYFLEQAERELARITAITTHTLRFYREPNRPVPTRVSGVLDSVLVLHHSRLVTSGIQVRRQDRNPAAAVLSSPGELRQITANIVGNAIDAMRQGGRLTIRTSKTRLRSGEDAVRLTIADKGTGISADLLPRIFEPFVTTKGETGTGLGLWVTTEIVNRNGWKLQVRSKQAPGRSGTVFSLLMPAVEAGIA